MQHKYIRFIESTNKNLDYFLNHTYTKKSPLSLQHKGLKAYK